MRGKPPPRPPRPDLLRRPEEPFGWLEDRLLHEGWLGRLGPDAASVLLLLALAADGRGASYYGRKRMAASLAMPGDRLDQALTVLLDQNLITFRPWNSKSKDGVWQLLPLPKRGQARASRPAPDRPRSSPPSADPENIADIIQRLGFPTAPTSTTPAPSSAPESGGS